ncbi:MAG TPA: fatty acid desaturase [Solirubrobacteraceae bacterium]|jgi:omega-6 fatty acid desaturase (delta-12 desaturase)|nr:fatty acid desaturase [Solirubrobacteraceae bacterium]
MIDSLAPSLVRPDPRGAPQPPPEVSRDPAFWREVLSPYAKPDAVRSIGDLLTSAVAYLAMCVAMYFVLQVSLLLTLALAPLAAAFLLRTYIVFHDCSHGSFLASRRGNQWLGTLCGLLVLSPFIRWRHDHAVHHATSGDLDKRGVGDVPTLTVAEYYARDRRGRLGYRLIRNPIVMFGLGPLFAMIIGPRIVARNARPRMRNSVIWTDVALAAMTAALIWLIGIGELLAIWLPAAFLAGAAGIWLFYAQHQFEDAYWEHSDTWSFPEAALRGSSFLKLPGPLRFASGNIGYHHIHHLSARIPNYNLPRAHEQLQLFQDVPTLGLWDGLRAVRLKLWDEQQGRLVTFAQASAGRP